MKKWLSNLILSSFVFSGADLATAKKCELPSVSPTPCVCIRPESPIEEGQCPASFNLPAAIRVSNPCGWQDDLFFDASAIYWYAGEQGLDLGRNGDFAVGDDPMFDSSTQVLSQPFEYRPGFKVAAGWRKNDWVVTGEYTWVRNSTFQDRQAPISHNDLTVGVWLIAPWFLQESGLDQGSLSGTRIASKWRLAMDIADLSVSRPFYQGRRLTVLPFGGLRAAWIRQKMQVSLTEVFGLFSPLPSQPIHSLTGSNSWSIGPRFGTAGHGLIGWGFRVQGDLALSLLFTEYTKVYHREDPDMVGAIPDGIQWSIRNRTALRPVLEAGLGLGWGRYISADRFYIDFSADYDFNYWWNQNMMKEWLTFFWREISSNGDLYLHGLTVTGRFDF